MKSLLEEFKKFAMRGNVVDLAVAVVIGAAFGKIVSSLVENIIMPLVGVVTGGVDFSNLAFNIQGTAVTYGVFLQSVIDFLIISFAIFAAIKLMNRFHQKESVAPETKKIVEPSEEVKLLREIRDAVQK